jgi:hypothetical protein
MNNKYTPDLLKKVSNELYNRLSADFRHKSNNKNLAKRNKAELECLLYIKTHGKCPEIK